MEIKFTPEGEKDLKKLSKTIQERVIEKLFWFKNYFSEIILEPLSNVWRGYFKLRAGDWRIIYEIDYKQDLIIIHRIEHRSKVYQ